MNQHFAASRRLLLEQLESRCLLNGDFPFHGAQTGAASHPERFDSFDFAEIAHRPMLRVDQAELVGGSEGAATSRPIEPRGQSDAYSSMPFAHRDSSESPTRVVEVPNPRPNSIETPILNSNPAGAPSRLQQVVLIIEIRQPFSLTPNITALSSGTPRGTSSVGFIPGEVAGIHSDGDVAARTNDEGPELLGEGPEFLGVHQTSDAATRRSLDVIQSLTATPRQPSLASGRVQSQAQTSPWQVSLESDHATGEIESLPVFRRELQTVFSDAPDRPWRVDAMSLRRLRDLSRPSSTHATSDSNAPAPLVLDSWFTGPTGLVQIESRGKLQPPTSINPASVDVALTATVGRYRSIDLIAGETSESPTISDEVRNAILSAISEQQTGWGLGTLAPAVASVDLSAMQAPTRLASITYPCAVVLAAGVVMGARRKRRESHLKATTPRQSQDGNRGE